ncbi:MAG: mechanosensitive ion channel family protein [Terriglobia bacterium]
MPSGRAQAAHYVRALHHVSHITPRVIIYVFIAAAFIIALLLGYGLKRLLHHWRVRARTPWAELFLAIVEQLPVPLLLLAALYSVMEFLPLPGKYEKSGSELIFALVVVVIFYFLTKAISAFLHRLAQREPRFERVTQPAVFVVRLLFVILATIIILENLGIHLVALWTTLGVGSVAIALGLQETLSNAFAGLYIMADQPVGPGDYIKLDSGQEGYVVKIGWRATALRTLSNNFVYVPNASVAKAMITNYSKPEERMSIGIAVSVGYDADPYKVERLLVEIAQQAAEGGLEGLLALPAPSARLIPGFGASSLDFSLNVQVRRFADQYLVQSELRKKILERFNKEGISMPFPTRSILLDQSVVELLHGRDKG